MKKSDTLVLSNLRKWSALADMPQNKLAPVMGMSASTLNRRKRNPGEMTLDEFRSFCKHSRATNDEIIAMIRG